VLVLELLLLVALMEEELVLSVSIVLRRMIGALLRCPPSPAPCKLIV
jgi:hypothetical protein